MKLRSEIEIRSINKDHTYEKSFLCVLANKLAEEPREINK